MAGREDYFARKSVEAASDAVKAISRPMCEVDYY